MRKTFHRFQVDLLIIGAFLLLPLLLFGDVTLGGRTMLPVDNLYQWAPWSALAAQNGVTAPHNPLISDLIIQNLAWKQFFRETVFSGDIPLWNPYLFAGVPFLAAGQHSMLYPFSLIYLIMPLGAAYGWFVVLQLWLAGVLMYVYGRTLHLHRGAAALAGLVFQGGGYIVVSAAVFPMIIGAVVWLPLLLACIDRVLGAYLPRDDVASPATARAWPWMLLGAVGLGMQVLAGHIEFTIYTLLVMALYAAWRLVTRGRAARFPLQRWLGPFAALSGMVALGLLLGGLQLLPLYELGQANFRQNDATFQEVLDYGFPPRRVLTLALPNFFGNPTTHEIRDLFSGEMVPLTVNAFGDPISNNEWGLKNYVEGGIYLGILPLFLAGLAVWSGFFVLRREWGGTTLFFTLLAVASLAFIFGTPLYALLYFGLPFVNQLHTPFRWVFPFSLSVAVLAGLGVDFLLTRRTRPDGKVPVWQRPVFLWGERSVAGGMAGLAFYGGVLLLVGLLAARPFYTQLAPFVERLFMGLAKAAYAFPDARAFFSYQWGQLLILALMLIGSGLVLRLVGVGRRPYWLFVAFLLLIIDFWLPNYRFHPANDPALLDVRPQLVEWLSAQPGHWRLTSFDDKGEKPFNANSGWLFNLQDVRGYDSIIPRQYTDYMAAIEPQNELQFNRVQPIANWESLNSPLLDVLGVKYIISTQPLDALPKLERVWEGEGVLVYENLAAAPRAYTLPAGTAVVTPDPLAAMGSYDPRFHVVIAEADWSGLLPDDPEPAAYAPAAVTAYSNREVVVEAAVTEPSWLVLNDSYFPGWRVWVRPSGAPSDAEEELPLTRVNGNFRGVQLEPGSWTVRFRYSPNSFLLGGLASFMGMIVLLFGSIVWGWRRFYRREATQSAGASIAKNSLAPIFLNLFNKLIDFGYAAYFLRVLGPAGAGSFQTAIVTAGIFDIISNYGLDILLIRDVSSKRERAGHYLLNTTLLRLGAAVVATLPVLAIIGSTRLFDSANALTGAEVTATLLIMAGMVFSGMSKGVTGLFYVHEEAETPNAMTTVTTILKVGFGVVALTLGYGFVGLAAVSILTNLITLALLVTLALRRYRLQGPWQVDSALLRQMVRAGFPLMLIHLLQTVFISIDTVLLRVMLRNGQEVVGWYSSAYKWFNALQIVPSFFTLALFPIISREIGANMARARQMYGTAIKIMLLLALPIAMMTHIWAVPLVQIVAGDEFLPAGAIALQIVVWSIPLGWMNSVTNYVLISLGLERLQPRAFGIAVTFNIVTNLIFIPFFSYQAAAVTTILSELVLLVLFESFLRKRMPGVAWGGMLLRPFFLTAVTFGVMWGLAQLHLLLAPLGLLLYPVGLFGLRIITAEERAFFLKLLPAGIGRRLGVPQEN